MLQERGQRCKGTFCTTSKVILTILMEKSKDNGNNRHVPMGNVPFITTTSPQESRMFLRDTFMSLEHMEEKSIQVSIGNCGKLTLQNKMKTAHSSWGIRDL